ncbi:MAG: hypothetical protein HY241_10490 [Actinobacteria bacterium]|nr:hypothetical protein [Actinomycetota bacterium]
MVHDRELPDPVMSPQVVVGAVQFGILLVVLGFGSAVLSQYTDVEFPLLSWVNRYQPTPSLVVGALGLLVAAGSAVGRVRSRGRL